MGRATRQLPPLEPVRSPGRRSARPAVKGTLSAYVQPLVPVRVASLVRCLSHRSYSPAAQTGARIHSGAAVRTSCIAPVRQRAGRTVPCVQRLSLCAQPGGNLCRGGMEPPAPVRFQRPWAAIGAPPVRAPGDPRHARRASVAVRDQPQRGSRGGEPPPVPVLGSKGTKAVAHFSARG